MAVDITENDLRSAGWTKNAHTGEWTHYGTTDTIKGISGYNSTGSSGINADGLETLMGNSSLAPEGSTLINKLRSIGSTNTHERIDDTSYTNTAPIDGISTDTTVFNTPGMLALDADTVAAKTAGDNWGWTIDHDELAEFDRLDESTENEALMNGDNELVANSPGSGGSSTWSGSTLGDRFTDLSGTGLSNEVGGKLANAAYDNIGYSSNKYTPEYSKLGISQEQYNNLDTRSKFALDESQGNINADAFSYDKNLGKSPNLTGMEAAQVGLGLAGLAATIDNNKFNQRMARKNYGLAQDQFDVAKADIGYKDDGTTNRSRTQYSLGTAFA